MVVSFLLTLQNITHNQNINKKRKYYGKNKTVQGHSPA